MSGDDDGDKNRLKIGEGFLTRVAYLARSGHKPSSQLRDPNYTHDHRPENKSTNNFNNASALLLRMAARNARLADAAAARRTRRS